MANGKSKGLAVFACIVALLVGLVAGFFLYAFLTREEGGDVYVSGDLQIHFMELGNAHAGDSVYIKAGDADILIDAGSTRTSTNTTAAYMEQYVTDGTLEYVIVTHADEDHIAGFAGTSSAPSMFDRFTCEVIIDFARTNKDTVVYNDYVSQRDEAVTEGAVHYTALECWNNENGAKRTYEVSDGIEMSVLYNYYYEHSSDDENNYSVCLLFSQGDKHFLFTGDLEEDGEARLVENNDLPEVELFKAGHHGSKTSSTDALLSVIKPKIVCVCCCAGTDEYTDTPANQFPTQAMIDRVAPYTEQVYVTSQVASNADGYTSMNGNIVVTSNRGGVTVQCSNNNTLLKDTDWFKANRETPAAWA